MVQNPNNPDLATIREITELKLSLQDINSKMHHVTNSAPQIDSVLATALKTPFSRQISEARLESVEKFRLPSYSGVTDPSDHMKTFNIAMGRAKFERGLLLPVFIESLSGAALTWFSRILENSIESLCDLSAAFLKHYIMFTRQGATASDLWQRSQALGQTLHDLMEKLKSSFLL